MAQARLWHYGPGFERGAAAGTNCQGYCGSMTNQAPGPVGPDLRDKVAFLRRAEAYPDGAAEVTAVETSMSWIFLAGQLAYKLKKPVVHPSADLRTPEARRHFCEEEVRLNRRLAPEVYLGTLPLTGAGDGSLAVGGDGAPVDWLVKMRRLPAARMLDAAIRTGDVKTRELRTVAGLLARFFRGAVPVAIPPGEYRRRLADAVTASRRTLTDPSAGVSIRSAETITAALRKFLMGQAPLFDRRVRRGRVRDGHGDLRAEHVFLGPKAAVIDSLEFSRDDRIQDSADELSGLAADCEILGSPGAGKVVLESCCDRLGDDPPPELLAFHKARRAMMCARWLIMQPGDAPAGESADRRGRAEAYLGLAEKYARQLR